MKILIVEDERQLSDSIVAFLVREDYLCEQAFTYDEAMSRVEAYDYDCILLDLMLPGGNGLDILRRVKQIKPQAGVIVVSAKDSLDDKVDGLRIGADDYLGKPFHMAELSMRVFALMRRKSFDATNVLHIGAIAIDLLEKKASVGGTPLDLTKSEYELLLLLIENRRRVIPKSAIAEHLSGDMADMLDDFSFVYAHIKNLKSKLSAVGVSDCIKTYYGNGYKWMLENED